VIFQEGIAVGAVPNLTGGPVFAFASDGSKVLVPDQENVAQVLNEEYGDTCGGVVSCLHVRLPVVPEIVEQRVLPRVPLCAAEIHFTISAPSISETEGSVTIEVARSGKTDNAVDIRYRTSDGSATGGVDYVATAGVLSFGPGEILKSFSIPVLVDSDSNEGPETVNLTLEEPSRGAVLGDPRAAVLTILDATVEVEQITTISGWTGEALATRRTWSIDGQEFVEIIRHGVSKRICPVTGVSLLDAFKVTWNVWKFVPLPDSFITPGATPPDGAVVTVKPDNVITEGCQDLDPQRRFSSGPADCPPTIVNDETFITSTSPNFTFPLCFSTHSCGLYDPASPYLGQPGYTAELLTGCIMEECPTAYGCPDLRQ
jgi:hypothetical protein